MHRLRKGWLFLKNIWNSFSQHRGSLMAAALAFYSLLSLLPLMLLGVVVFGYVLGSSDRSYEAVVRMLQRFLPTASEEITKVLTQLVQDKTLFGGIGLLGLIWSGMLIFVNLEQALNLVFRASKDRHYLHSRLIALAMVVLCGGLLLLSISLTSLAALVGSFHIPVINIRPEEIPFLWPFLVGVVIPWTLSILMFTLIYRCVPNYLLPWRLVWIASISVASLWEIIKHAFRYYLTHYALYNRLYGSLTGVIILILWIYYSAILLLLGAEAICQWSRDKGETKAEN